MDFSVIELLSAFRCLGKQAFTKRFKSEEKKDIFQKLQNEGYMSLHQLEDYRNNGELCRGLDVIKKTLDFADLRIANAKEKFTYYSDVIIGTEKRFLARLYRGLAEQSRHMVSHGVTHGEARKYWAAAVNLESHVCRIIEKSLPTHEATRDVPPTSEVITPSGQAARSEGNSLTSWSFKSLH